jgi:hypothetical protein
VQVPLVTNEAAVPETVHTPVVEEANPTVNPDVAVAVKFREVPTVCAAIAGKLIVCGVGLFTTMICPTEAAAAKVLLPACEAITPQLPTFRNVTPLPLMLQFPFGTTVKLTGRPELAVALTVRVVPKVCAGIGLNVIVCVWTFTLKLCVTFAAAA